MCISIRDPNLRELLETSLLRGVPGKLYWQVHGFLCKIHIFEFGKFIVFCSMEGISVLQILYMEFQITIRMCGALVNTLDLSSKLGGLGSRLPRICTQRRRKHCLYIDLSKWRDLRVFSDGTLNTSDFLLIW